MACNGVQGAQGCPTSARVPTTSQPPPWPRAQQTPSAALGPLQSVFFWPFLPPQTTQVYPGVYPGNPKSG